MQKVLFNTDFNKTGNWLTVQKTTFYLNSPRFENIHNKISFLLLNNVRYYNSKALLEKII